MPLFGERGFGEHLFGWKRESVIEIKDEWDNDAVEIFLD